MNPLAKARLEGRVKLLAGFTLLELLVVMVIIATLSLLTFGGMKAYRGLATRSVCSSNLRQLAAATNMYCSDHGGFFPPYVTYDSDGGKAWFFGYEPFQPGVAEGDRELEREAGPLYPYIQSVGKIEVCPGFNYGNAVWKEKFKGASYGYGYNWYLGGRMGDLPLKNVAALSGASRVVLFGDCAQVNTFQSPASPKNPMLEEFYIIDEKERTVHFRHSGGANIVFVDGHVEVFKPYPGTEIKMIPGETLGRITKKNSMEYLE